MTDRGTAPDPLRSVFLLSYGLGAVLCVVWPLILQALLGGVIRPGLLGPAGLAQDLGYTFTGLVVLSCLYVLRRSRRVLTGFADLEKTKRPRALAREILLYSALFELSAFYGLVYHGLGGPGAERYARTFLVLSSVMFLLFVPRLPAWRRASEPATDSL